MPEALPRPASNAPAEAFVTYATRRMERAELAGLYYQGERDSLRAAYEMNAETQTRCQTWAREQDE